MSTPVNVYGRGNLLPGKLIIVQVYSVVMEAWNRLKIAFH